MNIVTYLSSFIKNSNLSGFVSRASLNKFTLPVEEQLAFLNKLGEPKDDYERSYYQYLCHCQFQNKVQIIIPNVLSFFIFPVFIVWCLIKGLFIKKEKIEYDTIACKGTKRVAPEVVNKKYHYTETLFFKNYALKAKGLKIIFKLLFKHPLSTYFVTKVALKIAYYDYMIQKYAPKAIIVENEYSFTSSVLTLFCEEYGVKHVDVMHGEKLLFIYDTFFRFHECYVWSQHYMDLLLDLRAAKGQFIIAVPNFLRFDCSQYQNDKYKSDYKYYLCRYDKKQLGNIIASMNRIIKTGKKVVYRPHPLWSDIELLESMVDKGLIENPKDVTIQESVSNTEYAVGSYTTVLSQAYYSGKKVVLDDETFKDEFIKLKELRFFLNDSNSLRLSQL